MMIQHHPRGSRIPEPKDFDKIDLDRSIQIYKERFANAGDFTFFFVGSFEEDKIKPFLEKYIGSLPGNPKKENFRDLGIRPPSGKLDTTINKGTDPKSVVRLLFNNNNAVYNSKDAYALQSLGEIPYSYSRFSVFFPCAPENTDTLTRTVIEELRMIITTGVTIEDLNKVKEQQKRKLEVDSRQNSFWMSALHDAYYIGNNPSEILNKQNQVEGLTAKMIQEVAKKYINPNVYIRGVLMPAKEATKPLKGF